MRKKMKTIYNLFNYVKLILIIGKCLIISVYAETIDIKVLMKEPDMSIVMNIDEWMQEYEYLINNYFKENNLDNTDLNDIKFSFDFLPNTPANSTYNLEYFENTYFIVENFKSATYDLMIIDERTLFNDIAFMETGYLSYYFGSHKYSTEIYLNLSKYIKSEALQFHDKKIIEDGKVDGDLYALPYEMDFDVLYYYNNDRKTNQLVSDMKSLNWEELVSSLQEETEPYPLKMSIAFDDDLLNFFMEYTSNYYYLKKEYDSNYFKIFYNDTAEGLLNSFFNLIMDYTEDDVEDTLFSTQDEVLLHFINGETTFFRGKASYADIVSKIPDVSSTLPPKYISAKYNKYLVFNKHSEIDKDLLIEIAQQLTSKDGQLNRAKHFHSIPTFDFTLRNEDEEIQSYCQDHSDICEKIELMNPLYIKDIFNTKSSPSFFKVEYIVPDDLRIALIYNDTSEIIPIFKNINEVITSDLGFFGILSYLVISFFTILFFIIYFVYKYQAHPYLKVISPMFCILIIIGFVYNMIKILSDLPPFSIVKVMTYLLWIPLG